MWKPLAFLALLYGCNGGSSDSSHDTHTWAWRNQIPRGDNLNDIAWNAERLVAVGNNGTILTSTNAQGWTERDAGVLNNLNAVLWTGDQFVAVGGSYEPLRLTGMVATSQDGVDWTIQNDSISSPLHDVTPLDDVAFNGNQLVAVSQNGSIFGSYDSVEWSLLFTGEDESNHLSASYRAITWAGDRFIAVGNDNGRTPLISTSIDGLTWHHSLHSCRLSTDSERQSSLMMNIQPYPIDVAWTGDQTVVLCPEGVIFTSPDGVTWSQHELDAEHDFTHISWAETQLVAATSEGTLYTSENALDWVVQIAETTQQLTASVWTGSEFVAVGPSGTLVSSTADMGWYEHHSSITDTRLLDVAWNGSRYIAVGSEGVILSSPDGIDWTHEASGTDLFLFAITWTGERFIAVGDEGIIISSPEGSHWRVHGSVPGFESRDQLKDIAWSGSRYVALSDGHIVTSEDGENWSIVEHSEFNLFYLNSIVWSGSAFVAVGRVIEFGEAVVSSTDGLNWHIERPTVINGEDFQQDLSDISFNGQQFVALALPDYRHIYTSRDGIQWMVHEHGIERGLFHTLWTGSNYIGVGHGVIATSDDAIDWSVESTLTDQMLYGIASSGTHSVVVGNAGVILSTQD